MSLYSEGVARALKVKHYEQASMSKGVLKLLVHLVEEIALGLLFLQAARHEPVWQMGLMKDIFRSGVSGKPVKSLQGTGILRADHPVEKVVKAFEIVKIASGERDNIEECQDSADEKLDGLRDALLTAAFLLGESDD